MDLSRAKTVLICAFLILNIFLGYQIWQDEGLGTWNLLEQKKDISRLETALREANLNLEVTMPRSDTHLAYLIVEPWKPQARDIIEAVWPALDSRKTYPTLWQELNKSDNGDFNYRFGDYELSIKREGALSLKGLKDSINNDVSIPDKIKDTALELTNTVPFLNVFVFDYIKKDDQETVVCFRQKYEEYPLYAGYLKISVDKQGKTELLLYRLEPLGFAEQKRRIIPPSKALLRFLDVYGHKNEETSIIEFSLGYYSQEYDAQRWEIPPVWRVRLDNGEIYYINSFTGHLEN
ncbi:MAG: two-component system regulatory protein YycI [Dethiobacteria bacterium]|jgi:regulatory protein YycI of two-component signal transduction system YycFG